MVAMDKDGVMLYSIFLEKRKWSKPFNLLRGLLEIVHYLISQGNNFKDR